MILGWKVIVLYRGFTKWKHFSNSNKESLMYQPLFILLFLSFTSSIALASHTTFSDWEERIKYGFSQKDISLNYINLFTYICQEDLFHKALVDMDQKGLLKKYVVFSGNTLTYGNKKYLIVQDMKELDEHLEYLQEAKGYSEFRSQLIARSKKMDSKHITFDKNGVPKKTQFVLTPSLINYSQPPSSSVKWILGSRKNKSSFYIDIDPPYYIVELMQEDWKEYFSNTFPSKKIIRQYSSDICERFFSNNQVNHSFELKVGVTLAIGFKYLLQDLMGEYRYSPRPSSNDSNYFTYTSRLGSYVFRAHEDVLSMALIRYLEENVMKAQSRQSHASEQEVIKFYFPSLPDFPIPDDDRLRLLSYFNPIKVMEAIDDLYSLLSDSDKVRLSEALRNSFTIPQYQREIRFYNLDAIILTMMEYKAISEEKTESLFCYISKLLKRSPWILTPSDRGGYAFLKRDFEFIRKGCLDLYKIRKGPREVKRSEVYPSS